ncbi:MAG: MFS transporter [Actinobacteria bacterium]|nr:MFS transporter [Actinomycetota bacterium]
MSELTKWWRVEHGAPPAAPRNLGHRQAWATLAVLSLASFLLTLDDTAVSVALPTMQRQLDLGLSGLEWVVNAYTLVLAAFMLPAGRLADVYGRRRVFLSGLALFGLASLLIAASPTGTPAIASRVIQGAGAALMAPSSLSLISVSFESGRRGLAVGIWAGVSALALAVGPILGALITQGLGWRWIFLLNLPAVAAAFFVGTRVLAESSNPDAKRVDWRAAALLAGALVALLFPLTEGNSLGWSSLPVLGPLVLAPIAFAAFIRRERRGGGLVDLSLFSNRAFTAANTVILLSTSVMCSLFFFLSLYLQSVLGDTALGAGAALLPMTVLIASISPLAGRLSDRIGARAPTTAGMALLGAGLLILSGLGVEQSSIRWLLGLVLTGTGIGLSTSPLTATAVGTVSKQRSGEAAAIFNTFRMTGLAAGIAFMGAILTASTGAAGSASKQAFVSGLSTALTVNAAIALLALIAAAVLLSGRGVRPEASAAGLEPEAELLPASPAARHPGAASGAPTSQVSAPGYTGA